MNIKKFSATLLSSVLLMSSSVFAGSTISVTLNNNPIIFQDQTPVIQDGRTLIPLRGVFDAMGFKVSWNDELRAATITNQGYEIVVSVNSNIIEVNGKKTELDVPAQIINDRLMIPLRAVAESANAVVQWNNETKTAEITYSQKVDYDEETYDNMGATEKQYMEDLIGVISKLKGYSKDVNNLFLARTVFLGTFDRETAKPTTSEQFEKILAYADELKNLNTPTNMSEVQSKVTEYALLIEATVDYAKTYDSQNLFNENNDALANSSSQFRESFEQINSDFGNALITYFYENEVFYEGIYGDYVIDLFMQ